MIDPALVEVTTTFAYEPGNGNRGTGVIIDSSGYVLTNNHVVAGAATVRLREPGKRTPSTQARSSALTWPTISPLCELPGHRRCTLRASAIPQHSRWGDGIRDRQWPLSLWSCEHQPGSHHGAEPARAHRDADQRRSAQAHRIDPDRWPPPARVFRWCACQRPRSGDRHCHCWSGTGIDRLLQRCVCHSDQHRYRGRPSDDGRHRDDQGPHRADRLARRRVGSGTGPSRSSSITGALVVYVVAGSPAYRLGIERADQVLTFAGQAVHSAVDLTRALQNCHPGKLCGSPGPTCPEMNTPAPPP